MVDMVINETNFYAQKVSSVDLMASSGEIKVCLWILFVSGYSGVPRIYIYRDTANDTGNSIIPKAVRRNRLRELKRYLQFERDADPRDRFSKVRNVARRLDNFFFSSTSFRPVISLTTSV